MDLMKRKPSRPGIFVRRHFRKNLLCEDLAEAEDQLAAWPDLANESFSATIRTSSFSKPKPARYTALEWAIWKGKQDFARLLIEKGADIHICLSAVSLVHLAIERDQFQTLELLLKKGAVLNAEGPENYQRQPIFLACERSHKKEALELLIRYGADVNTRDMRISEVTPLHCAASHEQPQYVEVLLQHGADVNALDSYGYSALGSLMITNKPGGDIQKTFQVMNILKAHGAVLSSFEVEKMGERNETMEKYNRQQLCYSGNHGWIKKIVGTKTTYYQGYKGTSEAVMGEVCAYCGKRKSEFDR